MREFISMLNATNGGLVPLKKKGNKNLTFNSRNRNTLVYKKLNITYLLTYLYV
jgi:hypothetical protein